VLPYRGFSASCDFQKGVCHTINKKILQVINQNIYGFYFQSCREKVFFKGKGQRRKLVEPWFPLLSTKIFMGFYFGVAEKRFSLRRVQKGTLVPLVPFKIENFFCFFMEDKISKYILILTPIQAFITTPHPNP